MKIKRLAFHKQLFDLPSTTGVYLFCRGSEILYIGKSVSLKARIRSHIENAKIDQKEAAIIDNATEIRYIETDSEFKALVLESRLIKTHKPFYNSRWRDDKSYLYIKITKAIFPIVSLVRRENDGSSDYHGPFSSTREAETIIREIRRVFPFCMQKKPGKQACFYAKIGLCNPCPSEVLRIKDPTLKKKLTRMYVHNIAQLKRTLTGKTEMVMKSLYEKVAQLSQNQAYEEAIIFRNRIQRFERLIHRQLFHIDRTEDYNLSEKSQEELLKLLTPYFSQLGKIDRIECIDMSNLMANETTASLVVARHGLMDRSQYRRFKLKDQSLRSDSQMLGEILKRRMKNSWPKPDLMMVDGGKPQVRTARQVFRSLHINIPLIGLAKQPDRIVLGIRNLPTLKPSLHNAGFNLLRQLRDESHRFAKKYHLFLRNKKFKEEL